MDVKSNISPECDNRALQDAFMFLFARWTALRDKAVAWFRAKGKSVEDMEVIGPFQIYDMPPRAYWDGLSNCANLKINDLDGWHSDAYMSEQLEKLLDEVVALKALLKRQELYDIIKE